jgi:hypothetical protein
MPALRRRVTMAPVEERAACALMKQRFEAAGFTIEENQAFEEVGIHFEIDGFDARHRVGYEYVTSEAGDSWDVDDSVIAALADRRQRGELHVLVVVEAEAPDAAALGSAVDRFLAELREQGVLAAPAGSVPPEPVAPVIPMPIVVPEEPQVVAEAEPRAAPDPPEADEPAPGKVAPPRATDEPAPGKAAPPRATDEPAPAKARTAKPKSPRTRTPSTRPKAAKKKPARK